MKDFYLRLTPLYHSDGILDLVVCAEDKYDAIAYAEEQDPFDGGKISIKWISECVHYDVPEHEKDIVEEQIEKWKHLLDWLSDK